MIHGIIGLGPLPRLRPFPIESEELAAPFLGSPLLGQCGHRYVGQGIALHGEGRLRWLRGGRRLIRIFHCCLHHAHPCHQFAGLRSCSRWLILKFTSPASAVRIPGVDEGAGAARAGRVNTVCADTDLRVSIPGRRSHCNEWDGQTLETTKSSWA